MPTPIDYANTVLTGILNKPVGEPRDYTKEYGGIPTLPAYTQDVSTVLGEDVQAQMIQNLPNYQAMLGEDVGNIMSNLSGQVPADVLTQLQQRGAERGVAMGGAGSPAANAAYLRALGLTSLQLQQLGNEQLTKAMARTPIQKQQTTVGARDLGVERAQYAGAPDPKAAAEQALKNAMAGIRAGGAGIAAPALTYATGGAKTFAPMSGADASGQFANEWLARQGAARAATFAETDRARLFGASPAMDIYGGFGGGLGDYDYGDLTPYVPGTAPADTYYSGATDQSVYNPMAQYDYYGVEDAYYNPETDQSMSPGAAMEEFGVY